MTGFTKSARSVAACGGSMLAIILYSSAASAQQAAPSGGAIRNSDDIVVTGTRVNAATPITSSIHTTEPQAIVSRSIIDNSVPPTADISDIVLLTPGASGTSNGNGPGLSESKTVLRGFQDGFFNMTYDGIPFGDSNNPTHHSTAYFPTGTYERIIVDRGPGGATDLGQASFGGNIHIVSRELSDKSGLEAQAVYGSYRTYLGRLTLQSGSIEKLGGLRIIAVGEYKDTKGALSASPAFFVNGFVKAELPIGTNAKFSILSSYNQDYYQQSDNNGVTCTGALVTGGAPTPGLTSDGKNCLATSQVGLYGRDFGLVDPADSRFSGTPWPNARTDFNWTNKATDFEIARLQWNFNDAISFDNKAYTYFYKNFTVSTQSSTIPCGTTPTVSNCRSQRMINGVITTVNGDIPGYTKVNQYRMWGDVAQVDFKTSFGVGKVGLWYEKSNSKRYRYSYDLSAAFAAGAFANRHFDFAAMANFFDYNRNTNTSVNVMLNGQPVPTYIAYDEHTSWEQIQGFGEFNLKLFDDRLTITPGVKVQNFTRRIDTPIASQTARVGIQASQSYKPTLPYATVNFLAQPNWSFYAQYAKGFLVPQLSDSLEAVIPDGAGGVKCSASSTSGGNCNLQPTKTTNYQVGTVYAGERLNIDADLYYITASNSTSVDPSTGIGKASGTPAIYKGAEAQVSYQFVPHLTGIVNGSVNSAKNDDPGKKWLSQAPNYTALIGLVYNSKSFKLSYLHKFTGRQFADSPSASTTAGVTTYAGELVRIAPYSSGILSGSYSFGHFSVGMTVYNLFDDQSTTKVGSPTGATPLYFFQPGRSYQAQVRVKF